MKVEYLIGNRFDEACKELATNICQEYQPDLLIGVLTGGGVVGKSMLSSWPSEKPPEYMEIKIQRNLTKAKEGFNVAAILKKLPRFLTRWLINVEVFMLEHFKSEKPERFLDEPSKAALFQKIEACGCKTVLIIDDTIDTGATIKTLVDLLKDSSYDLDLKVAAITTTHKHPVVTADYSLYNRVICRFPWSMEIEQG